MQRNDVNDLFRKARQDDFESNYRLGIDFYWGIDGFPKDIIQAKKHFLIALLSDGCRLLENTSKVVASINFIRVIDMKTDFDIELEVKRTEYLPDFSKALPYLPNLNYYFSKENRQISLKEIENKFGILSKFEENIYRNSSTSLKNIWFQYIYNRMGLFKDDIEKLLPTDLQTDLKKFSL